MWSLCSELSPSLLHLYEHINAIFFLLLFYEQNRKKNSPLHYEQNWNLFFFLLYFINKIEIYYFYLLLFYEEFFFFTCPILSTKMKFIFILFISISKNWVYMCHSIFLFLLEIWVLIWKRLDAKIKSCIRRNLYFYE